jgi:cytochrome c peroxidase
MKKCISIFCIPLLIACNTEPETADAFFYKQVPLSIKDSIYVDSRNLPSEQKIKLGRYLFYDTRLSINNTKSCGSCHDPKFSFTDGYRRSIGAYGDLTEHNAPPLINLIFNQYLTAADSSLHFPEQQIQNPMFHDAPIELGWKNHEQGLLQRISSDQTYQQLFQKAFPNEKQKFTLKNVQYSISSFVKTIVSFESAYDKKALNKNEQKGFQLFQSKELKCSQCHSGVNFNQPQFQSSPYFNTGFFSHTSLNKGLFAFTNKKADWGKYKVPTLRNLAFTAPYLHDGSAETLEQVIQLYEIGGQPSAINKHPLITGFKLNSQQRSELIAFLLSLSDSTVITNNAYTNPWNTK